MNVNEEENVTLGITDNGIVYSTRNKQEHDDIINITQALVDNNGYKIGQYIINCSNRYMNSLESLSSSVQNEEINRECSIQRRVSNEDQFCDSMKILVNNLGNMHTCDDITVVINEIYSLIVKHDIKLDPVYINFLLAYLITYSVIYNCNKLFDMDAAASAYIADIL